MALAIAKRPEKRVPAARGGSGCLKLPSRRRSGGALIDLSCPTMPARPPVDRWDL